MNSTTIPQSEWPKMEVLVVLAAKVAGQVNHLPDDLASLTAQTAQLHAGVISLLTTKQLSNVMRAAAQNFRHSTTVSEMERHVMLLALIGQAAYRYVQLDTLEAVTINLMTVVLSSPTWQPAKRLAPGQQPQLPQLTSRDKMLLFVLSTMGSELGQTLKVLYPTLKTYLQQVRDFFESQVAQAPVSDSAQAQLTQALSHIDNPYPRDVPANLHWHNMACTVLAASLWAYNSELLSPLTDRVLLRVVEDRLELDAAYQLQRDSN